MRIGQSMDNRVLAERVALERANMAEIVKGNPRPRPQDSDGGDQTQAPANRHKPTQERRMGLMSNIRSWTSSIRHIRRIQRTATTAAEAAESASTQIAPMRSDIASSRGEIASVRGEVASVRADVNRFREETLRTIRDEVGVRIDDLREEIGSVRDSISSAVKELVAVRREVLFQQRRLTSYATAGTPVDSQPATLSHIVEQRLDSLYVALEDALRGSREDIKQRLLPYVERIALSGAGGADKPILDIGCGRGEWLELLRDRHLSAYGIDCNTAMIELATSLGLDARHADLLQHLATLADASLSAVTAFHVVEHLPFGVLVDFLDEALRVLMPGGIVVLETPNPETMRVGATTFYHDPTHRNPIPPRLLQFLVQHRGFTDFEIVRLHPFTGADCLHESSRDATHLNEAIFGPQDYSIIARRN
jgi:2-polyprenyl-3-methyl-5-hydroxy-6-metoxy-1,4-benzoquinol methylase